jgi:hypothetical protein
MNTVFSVAALFLPLGLSIGEKAQTGKTKNETRRLKNEN